MGGLLVDKLASSTGELLHRRLHATSRQPSTLLTPLPVSSHASQEH